MPDINDIWDDDEDMEMFSTSRFNIPDFDDARKRSAELRLAGMMADAVKQATEHMHKHPHSPLNLIIDGKVVHTIPPLIKE